MNDRRVSAHRDALEALMDSVSATLRIERWDDADSVPESLQQRARLLEERLATATKLVATTYTGSPLVVSRLNGLSAAIQRLARACADFRDRMSRDPKQSEVALEVLNFEFDEVRSGSDRWIDDHPSFTR